MNIDELKIRLEEEGVCPRVYSLFSDGMSECYVLTKEGYQWLVYYAERGERVDLKSFQDEDMACQCFLEMILSDPSARRKIFTPADFELSPVWFGNDKKGYKPIFEDEILPENYNNELIVKARFIAGKYSFSGYLVGVKFISSCVLFVKGDRIRINTLLPVFTEDNLKELYRLLNSKPFKFFPLRYKSDVILKNTGAISGELSPDS